MARNSARGLEVRADAHDNYNKRVDAEHAELVWAHPGMNNWYRNALGRVFAPMPWRLVDYWEMTRDARDEDYEFSQGLSA
jgi:4-hydroxyacetophenone monooxygenase